MLPLPGYLPWWLALLLVDGDLLIWAGVWLGCVAVVGGALLVGCTALSCDVYHPY